MRERSAVLARVCVCAAGSLVAALATAGFNAGDIVIASTSIDDPSGPGSVRGLVLVDPITGVPTPIYTENSGAWVSRVAYDSSRDRLLLPRSEPLGELYVFDLDGSFTTLNVGPYSIRTVAPAGDGRVYTAGLQSQVWPYLDASGVPQLLLADDGVSDFTYGRTLTDLVYDGATNALLGSSTEVSDPVLIRIPLSADGSKVEGTVTENVFFFSATGGAPEGLSPAPGGNWLLILDNNAGDALPRMQLVDPLTLAITPFASNGPYFGSNSTNAGCYSPERGGALVINTLVNDLLFFGPGSSGDGVLVNNSGLYSSSVGSNEDVRMIRVAGPPPCDGDSDGDGTVDFTDLNDVLGNWGMMVSPGSAGDVNGDGQVDFADLNLILGNWGCGTS